MQTRRGRTESAIARGDAAELLALVEYPPCACRGAEGDEPLCRCEMTAKQVRDAVSYAALKRGRLKRLTPGTP